MAIGNALVQWVCKTGVLSDVSACAVVAHGGVYDQRLTREKETWSGRGELWDGSSR